MLRGSSVERDGTPLSASSLVLDWYLMLRREREREAESWQRVSFNLYSVTVRYLQAAVPAAEQHVCKYWLQQHEA